MSPHAVYEALAGHPPPVLCVSVTTYRLSLLVMNTSSSLRLSFHPRTPRQYGQNYRYVPHYPFAVAHDSQCPPLRAGGGRGEWDARHTGSRSKSRHIRRRRPPFRHVTGFIRCRWLQRLILKMSRSRRTHAEDAVHADNISLSLSTSSPVFITPLVCRLSEHAATRICSWKSK